MKRQMRQNIKGISNKDFRKDLLDSLISSKFESWPILLLLPECSCTQIFIPGSFKVKALGSQSILH